MFDPNRTTFYSIEDIAHEMPHKHEAISYFRTNLSSFKRTFVYEFQRGQSKKCVLFRIKTTKAGNTSIEPNFFAKQILAIKFYEDRMQNSKSDDTHIYCEIRNMYGAMSKTAPTICIDVICKLSY